MKNAKRIGSQLNVKLLMGFSLLELLVVIGLLGVTAAASLPKLNEYHDQKVISNASENMRQILSAAREHHLATGAWPGNVNVLIVANRLPASAAVSPFGTPWVFNVTGANLFELSVDAGAEFAPRLGGADLPWVNRAGNVVSTTVTRAGQEAAHDALYSLDGSKPLWGDMDAANYSINNVNNLAAQTVNGTTITGTTINATTGNITNANGDIATFNTYNGINFNGSNGNFSNSVTTNTLNATNLNVSNFNGDSISVTGPIDSDGDIVSDGNVYGRRFIDTDDTSFYADPSSTSILRNLVIQGSLELQQSISAGSSCSGRRIGLGSGGEVLSCVGGVWTGTGGSGSTVLTGVGSHGMTLPIPTGFTFSECMMSASVADITHGGNPTRYGGGFAYVSGGRIYCGIQDSGTTYMGHGGCQAAYVVSCNK